MIKIEKKIPIPKGSGMGGARKYPFPDMKVGDSFLCNGHDPNSVRFAASHYGTRHGGLFSVRKTADGYRCWRVK